MKRDEMAQNLSEKMDLRSMNVGAENRARLKALFPFVFTETQNEKGEPIDAVATAEPTQFICLDRGFQGNDQLKANAVQTFAAGNQSRDRAEQILFRTV